MDTTWMKVLSGIAILMMIIYMYPRVKNSMENSPKATGKDWQSALIPIGIVVLFVIFLISAVR